MSFTLGSVNRIFNSETETFQKDFNLTHNEEPLFYKEFDASNVATVLVGSNTVVIPDHYYTTGEELVYHADGTAIGIDHTSTGVGAATTLPQNVFAIKVNEDKIKLAATYELSQSGTPIGLTTVGVGITHTFSATKKNTKAIISVDNIIQSPLYVRTGAATTVVSVQNRQVKVWSVTDPPLKSYDIIKIDDEYMRIQVVGYGGQADNLLVDREWLGSEKTSHSPGTPVQLTFGDYNIVQDKIHFVDVPFGGTREFIGVSSEAFDITNDSFDVLTEILDTGTKVKLRALDPPEPLVGNKNYYIIKNSDNNFSVASTKGNALVGIAISLTTSGIGTHTLLVADVVQGSSFQGRTFQRSDYRDNVIFDDISQDFTGIGKTYTLKSGGANTIGITTDFGALLLNNIFQKPSVDYNFLSSPSPGITSITFTGNANLDYVSESYSTTDVNQNRLPRRGIIASIGNSEGFGYQAPTHGIGTAVVSGLGTISVSMGYTGTGYTNGPSSYAVYIRGGNPTTGAAGTFTVREGHIESVIMNNPGVGYTWTDVPTLAFDEPIAYDDLRLVPHANSTGIGASVSVSVSVGQSISRFTLTNSGYGYTTGEQLTIAGIPTDRTAGSNFQPAVWTVGDVQDDEFAGWVFGKLQILDDISGEFNDKKKVFTLKEGGEPMGIESLDGSLIDLDQVLLIFIDDVLQKPGKAYEFKGGTQITFTEAPKKGSSMQVLFYRGTDADMTTLTALELIKKGDSIQVRKNPSTPSFLNQDVRTVRELVARDTLLTNVYKGQGITDEPDPLRPVTWTKQQDDRFVDGVVVSKSRDLYQGRVFPATRIIRNLNSNHTDIYTDGGALAFKYTEAPNATNFNIRIIDEEANTGFGTTTFSMPVKDLSNANISGDEGSIVGVGVSAQAIQFEFYIPDNSPIRENQYGNTTKTGIATGDYFVVSRSNVGTGATALSQTRASTVGIATTCLDGVYQVSHIAPIGAGQTMRVHVNVATNHGLVFTGLTSGVGAYYGSYSWAKLSGGAIGTTFRCTTDNGLTGLSTAPIVQRTDKLLLDYT